MFTIESIAQIDHSKEFEILNQTFHKFNPLKILRVDQYEIRHSNVLAWLINPHESHFLGNFFVKKLFSKLITKVENEDKLQRIDYLPLLHASFSEVRVFREVKTDSNRYIDILVEIPSEKLVLLIENKFNAVESEGQLEDYLNFASNKYNENDYQIVPIFLTLKKDMPSFEEYWVLDYNDILEIIETYINFNGIAISSGVYEFLNYYIEILQEELVQDEELIELALEAYKANKTSIELLYFVEHEELLLKQQYRFKNERELLAGLSEEQKESLKKIYYQKKKAIDYVFEIGSNVLRQAFLSFIKKQEFPEEVYKADVQFPNFILPEWKEFSEVLGQPEQGYWLQNGLIIWFERTWDEKLKLNLEVGPIPFENRFTFLSSIEEQEVFFRRSGKLEGKKYTKIYTCTAEINDWSDKESILMGMERLFNDTDLEKLFKKIAIAIEGMKEEFSEDNIQEDTLLHVKRKDYPIQAFELFALGQNISSEDYFINRSRASFLLPIFRELEKTYGSTVQKWWWHSSTFNFWFERLKDDRLKLTLELGPLKDYKRLELIKEMEGAGAEFSEKSKQPSSKFTRLFSKSKVVSTWDDPMAVCEEMKKLYNDADNQTILGIIESIS
ncbi:PD-(D/E)XK nuclease family protein [Metabacillus sp. RGM 3146]|uniref:PDDEXK-like family protein n=1 Tax=Metabacillus sp. RGM 3146 TaxID=3401092 RepID=UPI003B99E407